MHRRLSIDRAKQKILSRFHAWTGFSCLCLAALAFLGFSSNFLKSPVVRVWAGSRIHLDESNLAPGDVLFRRGRSLISRAVLAADSEGEYSHVGLVAIVAGRVWVLHATPPEEPDVKGGVIAEPLAAFLAPDQATAAALYRPRDSEAGPVAERTAWGWVHRKVPFDNAFDLASADRLYCTELVWRAYRSAGVDLEAGIPEPRGRYLLPGRLMKSPQLQPIREFREEATRP
jgi:hypothetical protein